MGQERDKAGKPRTPRETSADSETGLRRSAVAIDPPPRGALGIRDLLALLEKEVQHGFPDVPDTPCGAPRPVRGAARKRG